MSVSNELSVGVDSKFVALRPDSDFREAMLANLGQGESLSAGDLPRVPTPAGGGQVWSWTDAGNNNQTSETIDGVLVYYGLHGVLWGSEQPQGGVSPVLITHDLITATRINDDLGDLDPEILESCRIGDRTYDWRRLPYNQYGSAANGNGRRCKESRIMAILREDEAWPLMVQAGPGSLKSVTKFVKRLPVPHYRAIVSLTLQKTQNSGGQSYSEIVPMLLGDLSREEGDLVRRMYTEPLSREVTSVDASPEAL
jgi:hypothetical protein